MNRGAICVYDCTHKDGAIGGRFSAADVAKYIKVPAFKRTDKTYHPNITDVIELGTNFEGVLKRQADGESG